MKKIHIFILVIMLVQLLNCTIYNDDEKNGSLKLLSITPESGTVLQSGTQIISELEYSIKNYKNDDNYHISLCIKCIDPNTNENYNTTISQKQVTNSSGIITFSYIITDNFFSKQYYMHPYELFFQLETGELFEDIMFNAKSVKTEVIVYN